jgi:hypothetical protein
MVSLREAESGLREKCEQQSSGSLPKPQVQMDQQESDKTERDGVM